MSGFVRFEETCEDIACSLYYVHARRHGKNARHRKHHHPSGTQDHLDKWGTIVSRIPIPSNDIRVTRLKCGDSRM